MGSAWRVGGCGLEGGERREGERGGRGREEGDNNTQRRVKWWESS